MLASELNSADEWNADTMRGELEHIATLSKINEVFESERPQHEDRSNLGRQRQNRMKKARNVFDEPKLLGWTSNYKFLARLAWDFRERDIIDLLKPDDNSCYARDRTVSVEADTDCYLLCINNSDGRGDVDEFDSQKQRNTTKIKAAFMGQHCQNERLSWRTIVNAQIETKQTRTPGLAILKSTAEGSGKKHASES